MCIAHRRWKIWSRNSSNSNDLCSHSVCTPCIVYNCWPFLPSHAEDIRDSQQSVRIWRHLILLYVYLLYYIIYFFIAHRCEMPVFAFCFICPMRVVSMCIHNIILVCMCEWMCVDGKSLHSGTTATTFILCITKLDDDHEKRMTKDMTKS